VHCHSYNCFPGGSEGKESVYNMGDLGLNPGLGRSPVTLLSGEGNGNPLQYFLLENTMDRGAWWVHGVARVGHDLAIKPTPPI